MPERQLTSGERVLLTGIFGETLPYDDQILDTNDGDWGGAGNSITPNGTPHMSRLLWEADYSSPSVSDDRKWTFVHEMTHVWQYFHGKFMIFGAAAAFISGGFNYARAYSYALIWAPDFDIYNIEQQASIVADYYYVTRGLAPQHNVGQDRSLDTYSRIVGLVSNSGPPAMFPVLNQLNPFGS
jgi:hypothetical protein